MGSHLDDTGGPTCRGGVLLCVCAPSQTGKLFQNLCLLRCLDARGLGGALLGNNAEQWDSRCPQSQGVFAAVHGIKGEPSLIFLKCPPPGKRINLFSCLSFNMLCLTLLYDIILYYTMLYHSRLYYSLRRYTLPFSIILYYTILCYTLHYYTVLYSYFILIYSVILHHTYSFAIFTTILYFTPFQYTILNTTILC